MKKLSPEEWCGHCAQYCWEVWKRAENSWLGVARWRSLVRRVTLRVWWVKKASSEELIESIGPEEVGRASTASSLREELFQGSKETP